ncbi:hypothetical protein B0T26DRAFT_721783 [Lasiosphaeria miniovina]|uniref:Secreted protein n=1 Tax=Lasiosphaeria miniovina TaxID=1954250 RepID=A0AA40DMT8_9PEZI|nr:uncharacterized protein B0T26DRAFT_721783 [Lasiosphaeria miniovina]KAK0709504.1 hypothetical protein B0T26DRAFT_721783 [Lasiosphaeria miniovina]
MRSPIHSLVYSFMLAAVIACSRCSYIYHRCRCCWRWCFSCCYCFPQLFDVQYFAAVYVRVRVCESGMQIYLHTTSRRARAHQGKAWMPHPHPTRPLFPFLQAGVDPLGCPPPRPPLHG